MIVSALFNAMSLIVWVIVTALALSGTLVDVRDGVTVRVRVAVRVRVGVMLGVRLIVAVRVIERVCVRVAVAVLVRDGLPLSTSAVLVK
jgi:hypothetical protein